VIETDFTFLDTTFEGVFVLSHSDVSFASLLRALGFGRRRRTPRLSAAGAPGGAFPPFSAAARASTWRAPRGETWDLLVIGGGITGAAAARDAAGRGCGWRWWTRATWRAAPAAAPRG
jgi:hypothetical protein